MKGELRKPTVIGGLKIKSRNLLTFLACNPLQKLNPPFAQNLTSEVSLTKSYGFGLWSDNQSELARVVSSCETRRLDDDGFTFFYSD